MGPEIILGVVGIYSLLLFVITWVTSRKANAEAFYKGNNRSPWYVIAYGMIGASLSGVTFMSVPGWVGSTKFSYLMMVLGYLLGYLIIATVLLPLYYRLNLTSIYSYLETRFGKYSYITGASFFMLSRTIGASFRMFLVAGVLQTFVLDAWGVPFYVTVASFVLLILLYTYEGGIKTIIWTDTLQTTFMLLSVVITTYIIRDSLGGSFEQLHKTIEESGLSQILVTDFHEKNHWLKQILAGMFITIVMTGLDQEMMQKNLSCRNLRDAQKNMLSFSVVLVGVNMLFLFLGALLHIYAAQKHIHIGRSDDLFPTIALQHLPPLAGILFVIGVISAAYPSADGALTSLTTSFCIDILGLEKSKMSTSKKHTIRVVVHIGFAILLLLTIILFKRINDSAVVSKLFTVAGYTYGPLLGLYAFGLFTERRIHDWFAPFICLASPLLCYLLNENSVKLFGGYQFGFELLLMNGFLTFVGLYSVSRSKHMNHS
ncbi:MAG: sodium:solute symporter [Bacteroidota bacterium]|jgi:Na+/proline symporter